MIDRLARPALVGLELFLGVTAVIGGVSVVPTLPRAWLTGTPFPDYTIPALALSVVGGGALAAAALLLLRQQPGVAVSLLVGLAIAIFEVVETTVIGLDVWLHALGLKPVLDPVGAALMDVEGIPTLLGIPAPLWLQPFYFALGVAIMALAMRLWAHQAPGGLRAQPVGR